MGPSTNSLNTKTDSFFSRLHVWNKEEILSLFFMKLHMTTMDAAWWALLTLLTVISNICILSLSLITRREFLLVLTNQTSRRQWSFPFVHHKNGKFSPMSTQHPKLHLKISRLINIWKTTSPIMKISWNILLSKIWLKIKNLSINIFLDWLFFQRLKCFQLICFVSWQVLIKDMSFLKKRNTMESLCLSTVWAHSTNIWWIWLHFTLKSQLRVLNSSKSSLEFLTLSTNTIKYSPTNIKLEQWRTLVLSLSEINTFSRRKFHLKRC